MAIYDDYVWRLSSVYPAFDVRLPKDLTWVDETTWTPVSQTTKMTLSGAIVVQESYQHKGRPITLQSKEDMGWVKRDTLESLMSMVQKPALTMRLQFIQVFNDAYTANILIDYDVMFRHYDPPPLDAENAKGFDEFEPTAWFKIRGLKFMEVTQNATAPCSANKLFQLSSITGTFNPTEIVTGVSSASTGIVLSFDGTQLYIYKTSETDFTTEDITGPNGSATIDSIG